MSPVALRIVDDVSYVTRINHESHFAWQAQHLVTLVTLVLRACKCKLCSNNKEQYRSIVLCSAEKYFVVQL